MNAPTVAVTVFQLVVTGFRILSCLTVRDTFDHSPLLGETEKKMSEMSVKELLEVADTLHCLDGMSHQTMRKMGRAKLIKRIIADIRPAM